MEPSVVPDSKTLCRSVRSVRRYAQRMDKGARGVIALLSQALENGRRTIV